MRWPAHSSCGGTAAAAAYHSRRAPSTHCGQQTSSQGDSPAPTYQRGASSCKLLASAWLRGPLHTMASRSEPIVVSSLPQPQQSREGRRLQPHCWGASWPPPPHPSGVISQRSSPATPLRRGGGHASVGTLLCGATDRLVVRMAGCWLVGSWKDPLQESSRVPQSAWCLLIPLLPVQSSFQGVWLSQKADAIQLPGCGGHSWGRC